MGGSIIYCNVYFQISDFKIKMKAKRLLSLLTLTYKKTHWKGYYQKRCSIGKNSSEQRLSCPLSEQQYDTKYKVEVKITCSFPKEIQNCSVPISLNEFFSPMTSFWFAYAPSNIDPRTAILSQIYCVLSSAESEGFISFPQWHQ